MRDPLPWEHGWKVWMRRRAAPHVATGTLESSVFRVRVMPTVRRTSQTEGPRRKERGRPLRAEAAPGHIQWEGRLQTHRCEEVDSDSSPPTHARFG